MNLEKYMFPCLSKTLFGVECLGCGFQRGMVLLLRGELVAAFQMYPAIYTSLLFMGIVGLHYTDKSHNYKKTGITIGLLNGLIMIIGYYYKHF